MRSRNQMRPGDRDDHFGWPAASAVLVLVLTGCSGGAAVSTASTTGTPAASVSTPATVSPIPSAIATPEGALGGRFGFVWTAPGSDVNNLASVAADGSDLRVLTSSTTQMSEGVDWVPNSDRLLFDSDRTGCCYLFTMRSEERRVGKECRL